MNSRTENSSRNIKVALISKVVLLFAAFTSRTIFIRLLGAEYVGIGSLYSNILGLLNLADMGMMSVLSFELYRALKENDEVLICSLVAEFKKIYLIIICSISIIGVALIPFLRFIVNNVSLNQRDLVFYYIIFLFDSIASYFFVYRTTVINADQKAYINDIVQMSLKFVMYIFQSIYLYLTRDFLGYLIIQCGCTVLGNVILHIIATRMYPFLRRKELIVKDYVDTKRIFSNVKGTFLAKVSNTILSQTDSIIISSFFGTLMVGYYSNYNTLNVYVSSIMCIFVTSITASVGNLIAEENSEKSYKMFRNFMFIFSILTTFVATGLLCLSQDFVMLWIGEEYVIDFNIVVAIVFVFYQGNSSNVVELYRNTMGIFKEVQYMYLISAMLNIILSIFLGKFIGIAGVIIATGLSRLFTTFWYDALFVMKNLNCKVIEYYWLQLKNYSISFFVMVVTFFICSYVSIGGFLGLVIKAMICFFMTVLIECIFNIRTDEFKWTKSQIEKLIIVKIVHLIK